MKKYFSILLCAALVLSSCTSKQKQNLSETEVNELSDQVVAVIDSLATEICTISGHSDFMQIFSSENITVKEDKKIEIPNYVMKEGDLRNVTLLSQKYRAYGAVLVDRHIQGLYDLAVDASTTSCVEQMAAEINDKALETLQKQEGTDIDPEAYKRFYEQMKAAGRLDYFYETISAIGIETLYILSKDVDTFTEKLTDEQAASITRQLQLTIEGVNALAAERPNMSVLARNLNELNLLYATTVEELRKQLVAEKVAIELSRASLLTE